MKNYSKPLSVLLSVMLVLSMLSVGFSASAAETGEEAVAAAGSGVITVTSNISSPVQVNYHSYNDTVTVTYSLQTSHKIVNTQSYVEYDHNVLQITSSDPANVLPKFDETGNAVLNTNTTDRIYINATNANRYNFANERVYFTMIFNIIGSGNTNVNLNMEILTANDAATSSQATSQNDFALVNYNGIQNNEFTFTPTAVLTGEAPTEPTTEATEPITDSVTLQFALPKSAKAADAWSGADFYYNTSASNFDTATKIAMTKTNMIVAGEIDDTIAKLVSGNLDVYKVVLTPAQATAVDSAKVVGFSKAGATDRTGMRSGLTVVNAPVEGGVYGAAQSVAALNGKTFIINSCYDEAYETKSYTGHWTSAAGVPTVTLKFAVPKGNTATYNWGAADFYYSNTNNINDATRIPMENTGKVINATADNCSTLKDGQWSVYTVSLTEAQASAVDASKAAGFVKHGDKQNRTGMGAGNTILNATTTAGSYNSNKAAVSTFNGKTFIIDSYYNTSYPNQTYKGYWSSDQGTTPAKTSTIYFAAPYAEKSSTDWTSGVDFYYSTTTNINDATRVAMTKTDKVYAATSELSTLQSGEWPVYKVDLTAAQVAAAGECLSVGFVKADSTKRTGLRPAYSVVNATDNGYESTGADISDFSGKIFVINGAYDAKYENTTYTGHWVDYSQATSKTQSITLKFAVPSDWSGAELYYNSTQSMTGATTVAMTATNTYRTVNVNGSLKNVQSGSWHVYQVTLNSDQITAIDKSVSVGFKKAGSSSVRTGLRKAYSIANATTTNNYATYSAPIKNFNGKVFCIYNCYDAGNESGTYTGRWES